MTRAEAIQAVWAEVAMMLRPRLDARPGALEPIEDAAKRRAAVAAVYRIAERLATPKALRRGGY